MIKLSYGSQRQIYFPSFKDYYFTLGFLANSRNAELRWENNEDQGAWGSEGRIHCLVPESRYPQFFRFTAGRGSVYARINCNEYVATLVKEHNFKYNSKYQDVEAILKTVPTEYRQSFQDGYGSKLNYNPVYQKNTVANQPSSRSSTNRTTTTTTSSQPTPIVSKVQPPVPIEIVVGEKVIHKSFGEGTVTQINGSIIHVVFSTQGEKKFLNPTSFTGGFLRKK